MNFMEEFKNDLIDLFKKHKIMALQGSVELQVSPLKVDRNVCFVDVTFKFSKAVVDNYERKEYVDKYGLIIDGL